MSESIISFCKKSKTRYIVEVIVSTLFAGACPVQNLSMCDEKTNKTVNRLFIFLNKVHYQEVETPSAHIEHARMHHIILITTSVSC